MIANATNLTTVGVNRSVTLDLNGKTVTKRTETTEGHVGEAFRIFAGGALTVADLSDGQDGTIDSRRSVAYVSGGSLCVSNGTLNAYETAVHMDFGSVKVACGEVRVDVAVSPIRYAPASSSQNTGVLGFSLAPTATVTACSASGTAVSKVWRSRANGFSTMT